MRASKFICLSVSDKMGPDGYGYVIDDTEPGQSYPIHVKRIEGTFPPQLTELEGR